MPVSFIDADHMDSHRKGKTERASPQHTQITWRQVVGGPGKRGETESAGRMDKIPGGKQGRQEAWPTEIPGPGKALSFSHDRRVCSCGYS